MTTLEALMIAFPLALIAFVFAWTFATKWIHDMKSDTNLDPMDHSGRHIK